MEPTMMNDGNKSGVGPIIGVIIIIAVIVLGGLYFWGQRANNAPSTADNGTVTTSSEAATIKSQSS